MEPIRGPLIYVAGNVTVTISNSNGFYLFKPFQNSGLKKSKKSASKKEINAALAQLKVEKINPSQQKKANLKSSFEEAKVKADDIPSIEN